MPRIDAGDSDFPDIRKAQGISFRHLNKRRAVCRQEHCRSGQYPVAVWLFLV
jgi:hypothetical protein